MEKPKTKAIVPWTRVFAILAMLLFALGWFPIAKMTAHYEMGPNEGFNAYFQETAASGGQVYGRPPDLFYANYPPLSFHLVGLIGRVTGSMNMAGRWVSFAAWIAIGVFVGLISWRLTGVRQIGLYAALSWWIWLAAFDMNRIGFNDPHLLGIALNVAGLYCFLRAEDNSSLRIAAILFALSLFTKQTLLAFPAAVAIQLWMTSRKRFWTWLITAAAACAVLLVLTLLVDGRYFLAHLMLPRTYSLAGVTGNTVTYLSFAAVPFVIALLWTMRTGARGRHSVLLWAFVFAQLVGMWVASGDGAAINHFFDALIAIILIAAVALSDLPAMPARLTAVMLVVPMFLTSILVLPQRIPSDLARNAKATSALEIEFARAVEFVHAQPGLALCENLLVCFEAGKPETYDAFAVDQLIKTGHLDEQRILQMLAERHWAIIQLEVAATETLQPVARHRFSAAFMTQLLANYRLAARNSRHALLLPKPPA